MFSLRTLHLTAIAFAIQTKYHLCHKVMATENEQGFFSMTKE
jgi:hypothetical protein